MAPKFEIGQIIHHMKYGYIGVIVEIDSHCRAPESWYKKNKTQPNRNQPWYHVLVHKSDHGTYVAEENLELDSSGLEEIEHYATPKSRSRSNSSNQFNPGPGDPRLN